MAALAWAWLLIAPAQAATDYTDLWWAASGSEPGWGVNFNQQANFVFATFFVYGSDGRPTWFTAEMTRDGTGERFSGPLYRTTGTPYAAPVWQGFTVAQAGTATFTATSAYAGTLVYTVDGVAVTKSIERQANVPINVAGVYIGGASGRRSGCPASGQIVDTIQFDILHSPLDNDIRIDQISTSSGALVCRMEGKAVQYGKLLLVDNASYSCTDGFEAPARVYNLRPTATGFEAQWFADAGNGCTESGNLAGVTQTP
jgi:hypothetical protein